MSLDHDITRFGRQPCPHCAQPVDATGSADGTPTGPPDDGDFVVCFYCAQPCAWVQSAVGGALRKLTPDEAAEFAIEHGHHVERLQQFHRRQGR